MALTPEDNTGLANADSYVSLTTFKAYCTNRGIDYTLLGDGDDVALEHLARIAFTYVNVQGPWKSVPLSNDQAGEFPRIDLSDGMGRTFNTVPQRVKDAQCEAMITQGQGNDLFVTATRGGQVVSESVGPISTTYAQGATPETFFQSISRLLAPFQRDPNNPRRPLPVFNDYVADGNPDPVFSVGMDDNPEAAE
jgi:hypothetical protein